MSALLAPEVQTLVRPTLAVDLAAIAHNARFFERHTGGKLMAVVKADGFGHGAIEVARTALANGASWLGVATLDEALLLRREGLAAPLLSWLNPVGADVEAAVRARIDLAVPGSAHLAAVARAAALVGTRARVHLQIDVGMARDGAAAEEWPALVVAAREAELRGQIEVVGIMGHLPCADDPGHSSNAAGRRAFEVAVDLARLAGLRPRLRHLAATAAALTDRRTILDLCRIGAGLYGIQPSGTAPLRSALRLSAPVVSVREVAAGTPVGYGHTFVTDRRTRLALVPLGYADGIPRITSGRGEVAVHGQRRPIVGRVSMDQSVIDVGDLPVGPGHEVTIFGPGDAGEPTVTEWSSWADTVPHEIMTGLGARIERVYR